MSAVDKTLWARLSPLLDECLDLAEPGREERLAALRADDPELADALAEMLGHLPAIERDGFLDTPAMPRPQGLAGQAIGAYTLVRELGHGGMGTVWLARRTDGRYQGEVAIKFLRAGMFGHGDAGRFEREGSILARLSHPHIARLLDAGVTPDGTQPYLVLEYIDGEPIDQYCNRMALPVAARLQLFLDVLAAVAHAHNRLILHRDLKPSNILVTATGDVKLLDFGIAKLLDDAGSSGAPTELTAHAGNAFTPQFASPEQLQGGDVTTATDVYALGVLLYMLLGGEHPTIAPTGTALDRMRAVIEIEPKRLSDSVLRRGGPRATWSAASMRLAKELQGDVDTIVARALKKAPSQRYANAADLADDIRRYLAHEPIAARPDARLYRVAKFVRRHRTGVATATVAVVALGIGVGVALWQAREARLQRVQAEGLIEFMLGDLRKKLQPVGRLDVLDGVGEKALAYYAAQDPDRLDADSLGRRARALHMIGDLAEQRGRLDDAQKDFQRAADSTAELLARHPGDGQRMYDHSQSEYWLGYIQWRRGRLHEAEAAFRRYAALADSMAKVDPNNIDWRLERVYAAQNIAIVLLDLGRPGEALAMCTDARPVFAEIARVRPDAIIDAANNFGWIARAQENLGRYAEAIATEQEKIALAGTAPGGDGNEDGQYLVANADQEMARMHLALGEVGLAEPLARTAIEQFAKLVSRDPSNMDWLFEYNGARLQLARILYYRGDGDGARALLRESLATTAKLMHTPVPKRNWRIGAAGEEVVLRAALNAGPWAEIERVLAAYLGDIERFEKEVSPIPAEDIWLVADAQISWGDLLSEAGRSAEAHNAWQAANRRLQPRAAGGDPQAMAQLAQVRLRLGDVQGARVLVDRVMTTSYRHPALADLQTRLGLAEKSGHAPAP